MEIRRSALASHSAEAMFDIIDGPEHYPEFLPWCAEATLISRDADMTSATLVVRYAGLNFRFATENPKQRPVKMRINLLDGPFAQFDGEWLIQPLASDACRIDFLLRYEFHNRFATTLSSSVFAHIADTLVDAFIDRAESLKAAAQPSNGAQQIAE